MRKAGKMWILDDDEFFATRFEKSGDKFDYEYLDYTFGLVQEWDLALDIGAHYGSWTRPMSQRFKNVVAFEPRPDIFACLELNTKEYSNVLLEQCALGERLGTVNIGVPDHIKAKVKDGNSGLATVLGEGNITMTTVDLEMADDHLFERRVGLMKLDVEGYELHVLRGAEKTILKHKPVIIFEENSRCQDHNIKRGEVGAYLTSLGMKKHKVFPGENHIYIWE